MRKIDLAAIKSRLSEPRPGERKKREVRKDVPKERAEQPALNKAPSRSSKYIAPRAEPAKPALLSLEDVQLSRQLSEVAASQTVLHTQTSEAIRSQLVFEKEEPVRTSPLSQILRTQEVRTATPGMRSGETQRIDLAK